METEVEIQATGQGRGIRKLPLVFSEGRDFSQQLHPRLLKGRVGGEQRRQVPFVDIRNGGPRRIGVRRDCRQVCAGGRGDSESGGAEEKEENEQTGELRHRSCGDG